VPLSEHEQRQLEQIEQALYREDRRLARLVRSSDPRVHYRRRVAYAAFGLAVGAGLVAAGLILSHVMYYLAIAGFVVILLSGIWALASWRHASGTSASGTQPAGAGRGVQGGKKRRRGNRRAAIMETFEERWRRRQERGF